MLNEVNPYGREALFRWDVSHLQLHVHNLMAYGAEAPAESIMALDRVEQVQRAYEMAYEDMLQAIHDLAD